MAVPVEEVLGHRGLQLGQSLLNSPSRPQDTPKIVREGSPMIRFALWEIPTTETGSGEASLGTWYRRWGK